MEDLDRQANYTPIISFRVDIDPLNNPFLATETALREAIEGAVGHLVSARHVSVRPLDPAAVAPVPIIQQEAEVVAPPVAPVLAELSAREREVLEVLAEGKANKEIGQELQIATNTVRAHVLNILAKLGVNNRTKAARIYQNCLLDGGIDVA